MRRISVLGSTGSVGRNALDLIGRDPDAYEVVALTGGQNLDLLAEQARAFGAEIAVTCHESLLGDLRDRLAGTGIAAAAGPAAIDEAASRPADWILNAIVGLDGLAPSLAALGQGTTLALANKETLVAGGALVMEAARASGATLLPVDSEHSAIFQALLGEDIARVERVIVTASGGAFRDWPLDRLARATPEEAATHPNWDMGTRITIDSASMFNKALELIEARELFGLEPHRIECLIHPESLVHALVGFGDGALMAHLGPPDMRHAIGFALHYPDRRALPVERLDLARIGALTFRPPEDARYPALRLAREVMEAGGLMGAVFNAAKEAALDAFLAREIGFTDMARVVETVLTQLSGQGGLQSPPSRLDQVRSACDTARDHARRAIAPAARTA